MSCLVSAESIADAHAGFCVGAIVAFLLNLVMPADAEPPTKEDTATDISAQNGKASDVEDQMVREVCSRVQGASLRFCGPMGQAPLGVACAHTSQAS